MSEHLTPMPELCRRAQGEIGAADALRAVTGLRARLDDLERRHVGTMLGAGATWADIAATLGITRQAAHHRHRHVPRPKPPEPAATAQVRRVLVTGAARGTVRLAREEATALGGGAIGTEHLLLALARTAPVARVLAKAGVDEHSLRSTLQPTIVGGGQRGRSDGGFTSHAREVLEGSLREAVERGDGYIGATHLLFALLRNPSGGAAQTLQALGVEPSALLKSLGADT